MPVQIQLRGDTSANWTTVNPTLATRELGFETDTRRSKMGDGVTAWNALSYFTGIITTAQLDAKETGLGNPTVDGYVLSSTIAGVRSWVAQVLGAVLTAAQTFTKAQRVAIVPLTDAATIALDASLSNNFSVALAGNRTVGLPTNLVAGQDGSIFITQDATGSRTLAYNAVFKFAGGTAPVLTTTAAAVDRLDYFVVDATHIHAALSKDIK